MPRRSAVALVTLAGVALGMGVALSATAQEQRPGRIGFFNSPCDFTHRASDDPIVVPGRPGASHGHDFFGNPSVDAHTTLQSLDAVAARCRRGEDRSGYWVPTLTRRGRIAAPRGANVYYRTAGRPPSSIEPFPAGLRVVAGDASARRRQSARVVRWGCTGAGVGPRMVGGAPLCPRRSRLRLSIHFPECWDGRRLDSPDHASHMAYAVRAGRGTRGCPASHPHALPKLVLNVPYATRGGRGLRLSSGSLHSAHGDFFNAWNPGEIARLVRACLHADVHCRPPARPPRVRRARAA